MGEGLKDVLFHGSSLSVMDAAAAAAARELSDDSSSFFSDSDSSMHSSLEEDLAEDDASSFSQNSSSPGSDAPQGPLYGLSSLMAELPIKRGLSSFFDGKSQSFTSLSDAICIEDLAKKQTPFSKRMKSSKSCAGGLDVTTRPCFTPGVYSKAIAKKTSRSSCASLMSRTRRISSSNLLYSSKPPSLPVHK